MTAAREWARINPWDLAHRRRTAALLAALWIARYWASFGLHLWSPPRWHDWFDQGNYARSAAAFAHGDLSAAAHLYPLAYPLLAAPFVRLLPGDPFFIPDLALFIFTCAGFSRVMRRLGIGGGTATAAFVLCSLVVDSTASLWLIPWNTTLSAALTWSLIAQALALPDHAPSRRRWVALGLTAGALPLVRPTELLTVAGPLLVTGGVLLRQGRLRPRLLLLATGGGLAIVVPYLLLHLAIYGPAPSRYMVEEARQGFTFGDLGWKAYVVVITPAPWYPDAQSLIERLPWLVPGAAGLLLSAFLHRGSARVMLSVIAAAAIPYSLLFLAFTDLQPPGLWAFNNAHYFKWLFPLFGVGAWIWLRAMLDRRRTVVATGCLTAVIAPACLRLLPVAVPDDTPARLLLFRGRTDRAWERAYFAPATITDARGRLENVQKFHQLPDPAGERAIAIVRLFGPGARRDDPGDAAPFAHDEPPYARFRERVSVGLPCWFDRSSCALRR